MRVAGVIVNIFFPGIGTLIVRKFGQGIAQLVLCLFAGMLILTGIGAIIGIPLAVVVWVWAIVSAATATEQPVQVVVVQRDGRA
ncbi:hypothetical protein L6Q96_17770 [Candidatus Binatia bacterium]|nr:hypothetical protein [Candidatus Binatia bacterium]